MYAVNNQSSTQMPYYFQGSCYPCQYSQLKARLMEIKMTHGYDLEENCTKYCSDAAFRSYEAEMRKSSQQMKESSKNDSLGAQGKGCKRVRFENDVAQETSSSYPSINTILKKIFFFFPMVN